MLEEARKVLKRHYGYDDFRPGQSEALRKRGSRSI